MVPDVSVTGAAGGNVLVEGMIGMIVRDEAAKQAAVKAC
jgi:hypothetical protein